MQHKEAEARDFYTAKGSDHLKSMSAGNSKIIHVSNRLPVKIQVTEQGITYKHSDGGLATGLNALCAREKSLWIGWPGATVAPALTAQVSSDLKAEGMLPVFLSDDEVTNYYEGFSNEIIWPLFHYFPTLTAFSTQFFETYQAVNRKFADAVLQVAQKDDIIWIHDYQLMLLPQMLREALPDATIGFFLHIPFPAYPVYMTLAWRKEILEGLMGANVIGFQTYNDVHFFTDAVSQCLGHQFIGNELQLEGRNIVVQSFPISIDYHKFRELASNPENEPQEATIQAFKKDGKLIISVDRLDYSKGILQRLRAYELFLQQHPEWLGKVTYLHLVIPSRDQVRNYKELKEEMDRLISDINGRFATLSWQPIHHFYQTSPQGQLAAIYKLADVALVTPLRDGMNLVSKEYVACNINKQGVLVLSEMAGAARELQDALLINPNDTATFAQKIQQALTMPEAEKKTRLGRMQYTLQKADIFHWAESFMQAIQKAIQQKEAPAHYLNQTTLDGIEVKYLYAGKRLFFLNYDGTLVPFGHKPQEAAPDREVLQLLHQLASDESNKIVVLCGRDRKTLGKWLGRLPIDLIAEHGAWFKESGGEWYSRMNIDGDWKPELKQLLETYARATPGAIVEEKSFSLAWHYRQVKPKLAMKRLNDIRQALENKITSMGLQLEQDDMVIEIKPAHITKAWAAERWLKADRYDFVLAAGDGQSDEPMFLALPSSAITIRIGSNRTAAAYYLNNSRELKLVLNQLRQAGNNFGEPVLKLGKVGS